MILKTKSNMIIYGQIDDDFVNRIHERVLLSLRQFKIVYDRKCIMLSWSEALTRLQYTNLTEDISSLFNSINIPV